MIKHVKDFREKGSRLALIFESLLSTRMHRSVHSNTELEYPRDTGSSQTVLFCRMLCLRIRIHVINNNLIPTRLESGEMIA